MSGRRARTATHSAVSARPRRKLAAGLTLLALATTTAVMGLVSASPASAASITAKVQLASTGLADKNNPVGGSVIGIRPGDSVSFTTAILPTAGLDELGLGDLVDGLVGKIVGYQSSANFSKLPGGKTNTTVKTSPAVKFTFPKAGTYNFTWSVQKVVDGGLLGKSVQGLNLDGNQLERAGVRLNARNQYVGKVVVSNNPPKGGLSIQLPKVEVEPSAPVVGKLPKITIPGVQAPTIAVPTLGSLVPNLPKVPTPSASTSAAPSSSSATADPYELPGATIPEQVVPGGSAGDIFGNSGGGSGDFNTGGDSGTLPKSGSIVAKSGSADSTNGAPEQGSNVSNAGNTVELAADSGSPSSQLPVILAVLAIIALALVAGTYARLFLLKKPTS